MILKTSQKTRHFFLVNFDWIAMRVFVFVIGVSIMAACSPSSKKQPQNQYESLAQREWQMPDTASYARFGKTKLSDYGFFEGALEDLKPASRVIKYDINSPLFSDYAHKKRFIYLPPGEQIVYKAIGPLQFPEGATLIKNFYYTDEQLGEGNGKIIETRLLIKETTGWRSLPYVWNEEQTEAFLEIPGREVPLKLAATYEEMLYAVPTMLQCKSCHESNGQITPIGPTAQQLNTSGQLEKWVANGWLTEQPEKNNYPKMVAWEDESESIEARAHAYLEINCGHCHQPAGPAKNSGLNLTSSAKTPLAMGIYKAPVAAGKGSGGLKFDIVPGKPDQSILIYRMKSVDPSVMMPEVGKATVHTEGVQLIEAWITAMEE